MKWRHDRRFESRPMTSYQKSDSGKTNQCIYPKNNNAKFRLDPIWNDEALGFLQSISPNKKNVMNSDITWDKYWYWSIREENNLSL